MTRERGKLIGSSVNVHRSKRLSEAQLRKHRNVLIDLPAEVLDIILYYTVPCIDNVEPWLWERMTPSLFTAPILQTSSLIRQRCLEYIGRNHIWISVTTPTSSPRLVTHTTTLSRLSILPNAFTYLLGSNPTRVCLDLDELPTSAEEHSETPSTRRDVVFPFTFQALVYASETLNRSAIDAGPLRLCITYQNLAGNLERMKTALVLPALSHLHAFRTIHLPAEPDSPLPGRIREYGCISRWRVVQLREKSQHILDLTQALEQQGCHNEANHLLLGSGWIVDLAESLLPEPDHWEYGRFDPDDMIDEWYRSMDHSDDSWWRRHTARCPSGNKLRSLLCQLECKVGMAYISYARRYGLQWRADPIRKHYWDMRRILQGPSFTWFGCSLTELANVHYTRSLIHLCYARCLREAPEEKAKKPMGRGWLNRETQVKTFLEVASIEMSYARSLCPEHEIFQPSYGEHKSFYLSHRSIQNIEQYVEENFCMIKAPLPGSGQQYVWAGDLGTLENWGGVHLVRYLELAQDGIELSPTVDEWYLKRGSSMAPREVTP